MLNNIYAQKNKPNSHYLKANNYYLDGDTGCRKSTEVFKRIAKASRFQNQIYVTNKTTLLDQAESELKKLGVKNVFKFHTYDNRVRNKSVMESVNDWFQRYCGDDSPNGIAGAPSVLLCTEYALKNARTIMTVNGREISLPSLTRATKSQADLWIDELPEIHEERRVKVHNCPQVIGGWVELDYKTKDCKTFTSEWNDDGSPQLNRSGKQIRTEINDSLWVVRAKNPVRLKEELEQYGQTYEENQYRLLSDILSQNTDVYVRKSRFDSIGKHVKKNSDSDRGETTFQSFVNRSLFVGWNNFTLTSADYGCSFYVDWMYDNQRFQLKPARHIKNKLLNGGVHPVSWAERSNIVYCLEAGTRNSKQYHKHNSIELCNKLQRELRKLGNPDFLLCTNSDRVKHHPLSKLPGCKTLSTKDMGSNSFQKYHVVVFDGALNYKPDTAADLKLLGVTDATISNHMVKNVEYQIASRCSLRDIEQSSPVTIFVMEEASGVALAARFASTNTNAQVRIRHIDEDEFQSLTFNKEEAAQQSPTLDATSAMKSPAAPVRASHTQYCEPALPVVAAPPTFQSNDNNCTKSLYLESKVQEKGAKSHRTKAVANSSAGSLSDGIMQFNQYQCLPNKKSRAYESVETSQLGFARMLENRYLVSKEHPVTDIKSTGMRIRRFNRENVTHVVPLEFHGGITSDTFNSVFNPERQKKSKGLLKHSYVIHSSFDHGVDNLEAFKVWMYLTNPVCCEGDYQIVRDYVTNKLENAGHVNTGLLPVVENYYAPVVNEYLIESSFFNAFNLNKSRDIQRYGVDVQSLK